METVDRLKAVLADRYTIERQVGSGGMADVFLTHDRRHDRKVAIKVMHRDLAELVPAHAYAPGKAFLFQMSAQSLGSRVLDGRFDLKTY